MDKTIIAVSLVFALLPLHAIAQVYKWTDENGRTVYSSMPPLDPNKATMLRLPASPTSAGAATQHKKPLAKPGPSGKEQEAKYASLKIAAPGLEETIRSNTGDVQVAVALVPALQKNHKVRLIVDGKSLGDLWEAPQGTIRNLERGTHTLLAEVVDESGSKVGATNTVTFYLQQASALSPARKK